MLDTIVNTATVYGVVAATLFVNDWYGFRTWVFSQVSASTAHRIADTIGLALRGINLL